MTHHNYFFYFKREMPWKTPTNCEFAYEAQTKRTKRSGEEGEEVASSEKASDKSGSDSASKSAG